MSMLKLIKNNDHHGRSHPMLEANASASKPRGAQQSGIQTRTTASKAASYTEIIHRHTTAETNPLKMFDQSVNSSYGAISGRDDSGRNLLQKQLYSSNPARTDKGKRQLPR